MDINVDGKIFRCRVDATVIEALTAIRTRFGFAYGGLNADDTAVFPETQRIGDLIGALSYVDGQRLGTDRNKSPIFFLIPVTDPNETLYVFLNLSSHTSRRSPTSR